MKRKPTELPGRENPTVEKIRKALADLGECWMYRRELCAEYDINPEKVSMYRSKFEGFFFKFGTEQVWSGSKKTIEDLREALNA